MNEEVLQRVLEVGLSQSDFWGLIVRLVGAIVVWDMIKFASKQLIGWRLGVDFLDKTNSCKLKDYNVEKLQEISKDLNLLMKTHRLKDSGGQKPICDTIYESGSLLKEHVEMAKMNQRSINKMVSLMELFTSHIINIVSDIAILKDRVR